MSTVIDAPGVYDIPLDDYLADPVPGGSLSRSGVTALLPPSCPAKYRWDRDHPPESTRAFDVGHAAHKLVLGVGPELRVVEADDWRTKAARAERAAAYADGAVPLLAEDHDCVVAMAEALLRHPLASALFDPDHGTPEQSLFWQDAATGVTLRARLDWLPHPRDGRLIVPDYKTCANASPATLSKAVHNYRYHGQGAWYVDGIKALGLADDPAFLLVFQEKTPPYLVTVAELDTIALAAGRYENRKAIDLYAECVATDTWPGYSDDIELICLPPWAENAYLQETAA